MRGEADANVAREPRRRRRETLGAHRQRPREHGLAALEDEHLARLRPELHDRHGVGLGERRDERHERAERERADPHALGLLRVGRLHEVDARAHVLDARHGGDDRQLAVLCAPEEAPVEDGGLEIERHLRPELVGQHVGELLLRGGREEQAVDGRAGAVDRRGDGVRASGSPESAWETAIRAASPTPPLAATSAEATDASATLRYAERTSATFTLALPMSMPSHVGMSMALLLLTRC